MNNMDKIKLIKLIRKVVVNPEDLCTQRTCECCGQRLPSGLGLYAAKNIIDAIWEELKI